ncbi:MAG: cobalt-precorrin-6A reductase [Sulfitobacter sp.]
MRILLLGGTTEAGLLAAQLARAGVDAVFSYAGRTSTPVSQPLPTRIGGFGGAAGLRAYLEAEAISHVVDATHPFAAQMSRNAHIVCTQKNTPLIRLERAAWVPQNGDRWHSVPDLESAPDALPETPARVFLAIGKQQIGLFASKPQHRYLLRLVDAPDTLLPLPLADVIIARGPFTAQGDIDLMRAHNTTHVVAKNAGGTGAQAKLQAARALDLPVIMAARPVVPGDAVASVAAVMDWLGHSALRGV